MGSSQDWRRVLLRAAGLLPGHANPSPAREMRRVADAVLRGLPTRHRLLDRGVTSSWRALLALVADGDVHVNLARAALGRCLAGSARESYRRRNTDGVAQCLNALRLLARIESKGRKATEYDSGIRLGGEALHSAGLELERLEAGSPELVEMASAMMTTTGLTQTDLASKSSASLRAPSTAIPASAARRGAPRRGRAERVREALQTADGRRLTLTGLVTALGRSRECSRDQARKAAADVVRRDPELFGREDGEDEAIYFAK